MDIADGLHLGLPDVEDQGLTDRELVRERGFRGRGYRIGLGLNQGDMLRCGRPDCSWCVRLGWGGRDRRNERLGHLSACSTNLEDLLAEENAKGGTGGGFGRQALSYLHDLPF